MERAVSKMVQKELQMEAGSLLCGYSMMLVLKELYIMTI